MSPSDPHSYSYFVKYDHLIGRYVVYSRVTNLITKVEYINYVRHFVTESSALVFASHMNAQ